MPTSKTQDQQQRREALRRIHAEIMERDQCTWYEAVQEIARMTGRTPWTVRIWMSNRERGYTIPRDTLTVLDMQMEGSYV